MEEKHGMEKLCDNWGVMTRRRKIMLGLLSAAMVMLVMYWIWPDPGLELACYSFGVPVIVVNGWEWLDPKFMEMVVKVFGRDRTGDGCKGGS